MISAQNEIIDLLKTGNHEQLRNKVNNSQASIKPILEAIRTGTKQLPGGHSNLKLLTRRRDRLAGALIVANELRMPSFDAFGAPVMHKGERLTDYDRARTFILKQRGDAKRGRKSVAGMFYPEFKNASPIDRVLRLAEAHVGCSPKSDKQRNLFSLCGRYTYNQTLFQTQPGGTTCGMFMRAVLVAAGDSRFEDEKKLQMFATRTSMNFAMGLQPKTGPPNGVGWKHADRLYSATIPRRGDLYYLRIKEMDREDSGHVGFVKHAQRLGDRLTLDTIDGGQVANLKAPSGKGHYTHEMTRIFQLQNSGSYAWKYVKSPSTESYMIQVKTGEFRYLIGWVSLQAISNFLQLRTSIGRQRFYTHL